MNNIYDDIGIIRTVQVWLDDSFLEIELNQPHDWDEDKFYAAAADYVLSNISIDILQETYGKLQRYIQQIYRKLQK